MTQTPDKYAEAMAGLDELQRLTYIQAGTACWRALEKYIPVLREALRSHGAGTSRGDVLEEAAEACLTLWRTAPNDREHGFVQTNISHGCIASAVAIREMKNNAAPAPAVTGKAPPALAGTAQQEAAPSTGAEINALAATTSRRGAEPGQPAIGAPVSSTAGTNDVRQVLAECLEQLWDDHQLDLRDRIRGILSTHVSATAMPQDPMMEAAKAIIWYAQSAVSKMRREDIKLPNAEIEWLQQIEPEMREWLKKSGAGLGIDFGKAKSDLAFLSPVDGGKVS